jgi:hypothetical protein
LVLSSGAPTALVEGRNFTGTVATFSGGRAPYSAFIKWDASSAPTAATVTPISTGGYSITGSHTYPEEGPQTIGVTVSDSSGQSAAISENSSVADAPLSLTGGTPSMPHGSSTDVLVAATFTDTDPGGTTGDYSGSITFDNSSLETISCPSRDCSIVSNANGSFQMLVSMTAPAKKDAYLYTVTLRDVGGYTPTPVRGTLTVT